MGELYSIKRDKNYLAHYGVKGMKWKNHKYATPEEEPGVEKTITVDKNGTSYTTFKAAEAARQVGIEKKRQDEVAKRKALAEKNRRDRGSNIINKFMGASLNDVGSSIKKWSKKANRALKALSAKFGF